MKVVESFVLGKTSDEFHCEDVAVLDGDLIGVIDGATDKSDARYAGVAGGRFAALHIASELAQIDPEQDAMSMVRSLSESLAAAVRRTGESSTDAPSAVLALYNRKRREVWRVGDCSVRIGDYQALGRKSIDEVAASARGALLRALLAGGASVVDLRERDPGRSMILPLLEEQHWLRNGDATDPLSFGAIDGSEVPSEFVEVIQVDGASAIVLTTDGYLSPAPTLDLAEKELREAIGADPLCIERIVSTKGVRPGAASFDDRAYVRLSA